MDPLAQKQIADLQAQLALARSTVYKPGHIVVTDIIGRGVEGDEFRADFPTYENVAWDFAAGKVIIRVPDDHIPSDTSTEAEIHAHLDSIFVGPDSIYPPGKHKPVVHAHYRQVK